MFFPLFAVNKPFNRHRVRYQERNRKRNRRKQASRQRAIQQRRFRQRLGCVGTCKNMFSCMFSGQKVDWDKHGTCPGMMDTCCTSWNDKKRQKYIKSGRSLGPFSPQVQVYQRSRKRKDSLFTKNFGKFSAILAKNSIFENSPPNSGPRGGVKRHQQNQSGCYKILMVC